MIVNGTTYHDETPSELVEILERSRAKRERIVCILGDLETGRAWGDVERGTIGRSTGTSKIPLVIKTRRSMGGGALLDHCIIEVRASKGGRVLWKCQALRTEGVAS